MMVIIISELKKSNITYYNRLEKLLITEKSNILFIINYFYSLLVTEKVTRQCVINYYFFLVNNNNA